MEDILTVLPFGGTFDLVQIKGSTVKKAFEHSIHRYGGMSGEFLQVSGLCSDSRVWGHRVLTITLSDGQDRWSGNREEMSLLAHLNLTDEYCWVTSLNKYRKS